jgi:hypothetical protein
MEKNINSIINRNADIKQAKNEGEKRLVKVSEFVDKVTTDNDFVKRIINGSTYNLNPESKGKKRAYVTPEFQKQIAEKVKDYTGNFSSETLSETQEAEIISFIRSYVTSFSDQNEQEKLEKYWEEEFKKNYEEN